MDTEALRNGRAKWLAPLLIPIIVIVAASVLTYPILKLSPHGIPLGAVSLDEGAVISERAFNLGDTLIDRITDPDSDEDSGESSLSGDKVAWTIYETERELRDAVEKAECYAGVIVPADLSRKYARANGISGTFESLLNSISRINDDEADDSDVSDDDAPTITILVNQGENPMVTNSISAIAVPFAAAGLDVETEYINPVPDEMGFGYAHMPLIIITYLVAYATAALTASLFPIGGRRLGPRILDLGKQLLAMALASFMAGLAGTAIHQSLLGVNVSYAEMSLFLALSIFAFMSIVVAALDLFGPAGMAVPIFMLLFCLLSAYLPYEFLPAFWQDWIYPWDPLRFMVDGYKAILYRGAGFLNPATPTVALLAAIGLGGMAAATLLRRTKDA